MLLRNREQIAVVNARSARPGMNRIAWNHEIVPSLAKSHCASDVSCATSNPIFPSSADICVVPLDCVPTMRTARGVVTRLKQAGFGGAAIDYDAHGVIAARGIVKVTGRGKKPRAQKADAGRKPGAHRGEGGGRRGGRRGNPRGGRRGGGQFSGGGGGDDDDDDDDGYY